MRPLASLLSFFAASMCTVSLAHAATEYVYRADGTTDVALYVDGAVGVVDYDPGEIAARAGTLFGSDFQPHRVLCDTKGGRTLLIDVAHQSYFEITTEQMAATKRLFLEKYWQSKKAELAAMSAEERAKNEKLYQDALRTLNGETKLVPMTAPPRPSVYGGSCQKVDVVANDKLRATACVVPVEQLRKRPAAERALQEAETVFALMAVLTEPSFSATVKEPGLIDEIATGTDAKAHRLRLIAVRRNVAHPQLVDLSQLHRAALPVLRP
jgi:hypothetical protein